MGSLVAGSLGTAEQPKEKQTSTYGTPQMCYPTNCHFVREFMLLVASGKMLALHSRTCYTSSFESVLTRKANLHVFVFFTCSLHASCHHTS